MSIGLRTPDKLAMEMGQWLLVMGIGIDNIPANHLITALTDAIDRGERLLVMLANAQPLNTASTRQWMKELFARSALVYCDGVAAQLATWLPNAVLPHRHTAPEWIFTLGTTLAQRGRSIFWLDGSPKQSVTYGISRSRPKIPINSAEGRRLTSLRYARRSADRMLVHKERLTGSGSETREVIGEERR
ncbi:MAG: glycosyl transferase, WecB/TagA/CpsF family [Rhodospirillales bacterium]|jgi:UDP-N-acetyl-D-mannosaminuronic acid transferase (WecB/TagA/CpsF family)|nr:glycosyl transferase, WecB/TagA/CpsF family [Rhodospirillales bacterium]